MNKIEKINTMETERNKIINQIQDKVKKHKERLLENKLYDINNVKGNAQVQVR